MIGIDHVQVAAPPGCEEQARAFYGDLLGLPELAEARRARGARRLLVRLRRAAAPRGRQRGRSRRPRRPTPLCACAIQRRSRPSWRRLGAAGFATRRDVDSAGPRARVRRRSVRQPRRAGRAAPPPAAYRPRDAGSRARDAHRPRLDGRPRRPPARREARACATRRPPRRAPPSASSAWPSSRPCSWPSASARVLVVLQGMDASGKDGTVKHCIGGLNPMSVRVAGFKAPTSTELAHDFLWRIHQVLPAARRDRHLQPLALRGRARRARRGARAQGRSGSSATRPSTPSSSTSRTRARSSSSCSSTSRRRSRPRASASGIADPRRRTGSSRADDLKKRERWDDYMAAYRVMLERTSTDAAPWHIVPADHKWVRDAVVTDVLTQTLEGLRPDSGPSCRPSCARSSWSRPHSDEPENDARGRALARPPRVRRALGQEARQRPPAGITCGGRASTGSGADRRRRRPRRAPRWRRRSRRS